MNVTLEGYGLIRQKQPPEVFCKKGVVKISQNSQENTCARVSFLIELQTEACNFIKKETLCFTVNFEKSLRTPIFIEHLRWLLLIRENIMNTNSNTISGVVGVSHNSYFTY